MSAAAPAAAHGRVVARFGRRYLVALDPGPGVPAGAEADAVARGRRQDIVVGDRVACTRAIDVLVIDAIERRKSLLFRADASRVKPLAANVDQVAIVFAAQPVPQPEFAWRALVAARAAGIGAMAVLNKIDLPSEDALAQLGQIARLGARTLRVSARTDPAGTRAQLEAECRGRATLFVGQSGVGKSTLLNLLVEARSRTGALSRRGAHGRQTTTATRWFAYGVDGAVIDSPGFHGFGLAHVDPTDLVHWLPDFAAIDTPCRFADCRHLDEPGCAIRAAVEGGAIDRQRYDFYRRLIEQDARAPLRRSP